MAALTRGQRVVWVEDMDFSAVVKKSPLELQYISKSGEVIEP
jgi:hypothetical protein